MTYRIFNCKQDHEWQGTLEFLLQHRHEIHPRADFRNYFGILTNLFHHGEAIIALDKNDHIIGMVAYTYGTIEKDFKDSQWVRIEIAYVEEKYRGTLLFYQGFREVVHSLSHSEKAIETIECFTPNKDSSLRNFMVKFNQYQATLTTPFGEEDQFQTPFEEWLTLLKRKGSPNK